MNWSHEVIRPKFWDGKKPVRYIQHKEDGNRLTLFKQQDGRLLAWGKDRREHLELSAKLEPCEWFRRIRGELPPLSSIDGELIVPNHRASAVRHALAHDVGSLRYTPFAWPFYNGQPTNWEFSQAMRKLDELALITGCEYPPQWMQYHGENIEDLVSFAKLNRIEGFVLKLDHLAGWYKVKVSDTIYCVATGFKDGNGKYLGLVGAVRGSVYRNGELVQVTSCSGMSDAVRECINETADLGRVFEVEYERWDKNKLRHPRFVRWCPEILPEQCTWEQLGLEE